MSTLQVEGIRNAAATGDSISLAADGTCTTKATNKVVHNLLYNGEMQVNQRGTTTTVNGYGGPDRWKSNVSVGAFTASTSAQSPNNFASSLMLDCTTAATASANNNVSIQQHLEGLDLQGIGAGTSDAKSLTLSFWVKSTKTGVFNTILYQKDGGKFAVQNTTINQANQWEKKTFTVAGNTADAIANDNSKSLTVEFWLEAGPDYRGGTVSGSWHTWANNEAGEGITLNIASDTANNFFLTGVQLEMGDNASDYAYRSYGDELARCQRYFYKTPYSGYYVGAGNGSTNMNHTQFTFPVAMRAQPGSMNAVNVLVITSSNYTSASSKTPTIGQWCETGAALNWSGITGATDNRIGAIMLNGSGARLEFNSEL